MRLATRKCMAVAAVAAGSLGVGATAQASPAAPARPAPAYDCHVRFPHPPDGTLCYNGVWVHDKYYNVPWW